MTSTHTVDTAKAPAKQAKAPVTEMPAWFVRYNAALTSGKNLEGLAHTYANAHPLTADEALAGCLIGGPTGKPKRPGLEALWLALVLRQGGCTKTDYVAIKGHGFAMNCLNYASANMLRAQYGWVNVTQGADGAYVARLTPKGAAYLKVAGIKAATVDRMSKPYIGAAKVSGAKAAKPATDKPKATPRKPASKATKPADAPKPVTGTTAPATAKPASEPAKPVQGTTAPQGTIPAPVKVAVTQATPQAPVTPVKPVDPPKVN